MALLIFLAAGGIANGQLKKEDPSEKAKIRKRVDTIIREILRSGEITTAEGQRIIIRVPPPQRDIEEIRSYGDDAVPVLAEFLKSEDAREYELAMRLLGALGGDRIIQPLRDVILLDPMPRKRGFALSAITQAPWGKAALILRLAAKTDPDPHVRQIAKEMLAGYAP